MTILKVIPFGKDGTDGDSIYNTSINFEYHNEMTLADLQKLVYEYFTKEWGYDTVKDFIEDNVGVEVVGGWVILDDYLKIINVPVMSPNDTAADAVVETMKIQVQNASNLMVE